MRLAVDRLNRRADPRLLAAEKIDADCAGVVTVEQLGSLTAQTNELALVGRVNVFPLTLVRFDLLKQGRADLAHEVVERLDRLVVILDQSLDPLD